MHEKYRYVRITPAGVVSTFAGSTAGTADGTGTAAQFSAPSGMCIDPQGNLYVAEFASHRIRKITPAAVVTTFAGTTSGFADGNPSTVKFNNPYGICIDPQGAFYIADKNNFKIRKLIIE